MAFDKTKPFQTRDGRKARLLGEIKDKQPLVVVVVDSDGDESVEQYSVDGSYFPPESEGGRDDWDLVNIPERFELKRWANVYSSGSIVLWASNQVANQMAGLGLNAGHDRIACVEVTISGNVGDGLEVA